MSALCQELTFTLFDQFIGEQGSEMMSEMPS
jgi:hypothetical protein